MIYTNSHTPLLRDSPPGAIALGTAARADVLSGGGSRASRAPDVRSVRALQRDYLGVRAKRASAIPQATVRPRPSPECAPLAAQLAKLGASCDDCPLPKILWPPGQRRPNDAVLAQQPDRCMNLARSRESGNECRRFLAPGDRDAHALPGFTGAELRIATDQVRQHCQTSARPASRDWPHTAFWVHGKGAEAEVNMRGCRVAAQIHRDLSCSAARSRRKMLIALLMRRCIAGTAMALVCEASR